MEFIAISYLLLRAFVHIELFRKSFDYNTITSSILSACGINNNRYGENSGHKCENTCQYSHCDLSLHYRARVTIHIAMHQVVTRARLIVAW